MQFFRWIGNMTGINHEDTQTVRERLIALTRDLILIPSTESRPDEIERCIAFVRNYINTLDHVDIREYRHNNIPSLVALPKKIGKPEVLLVSHLDVVSHGDLEVYKPEITDGRIYGAGSGDMKGALAIMLDLFFNLHQSHSTVSLGLAVTSDEELGGGSGVGYLFDEVGIRCGTAIVPDGGSLNEITVAEKGVIHLHIVCLGHSSHAARPWLADNPLEKLLERVASLKRYFLALKHDEDHWYPTCTFTRVETPNVATNRIPSVAKADLDIRFPPPYTAEEMLGEITQILGSHIETKVIISSDPMEFQPDALFKKAIEEVTGEPASFVREDGASDSRFIQRYGIPVIISRPIVGELHSEDEWIDIDSMVKFYRICERYLERKLLSEEK
jgi:succinyl-diaminopimelate desuccinylase